MLLPEELCVSPGLCGKGDEMAEELSIQRRASILAEGLQIDPSTYVGMEAEAFDAMTAIKNYCRMDRSKQVEVLPAIYKTFGSTRPAFFYAAQRSIAFEVANPQWEPASLSNDEVFGEAHSWDRIAAVSKAIGGGGLGAVVGKQVRTAGSAAAAASSGAFWSTFFSKIKGFSPPALFFAGLQTVSGQTQSFWRLEIERRRQTGEMKPEEIRQKYGELR